MSRAHYASTSQKELETFLDSAIAEATDGTGIALDSAVGEASKKILTAGSIPPDLEKVFAAVKDESRHAHILDSVLIGADRFYREHGVYPTGDVLDAALQQGLVAAHGIDASGNIMDSAVSTGSTEHSTNLSAQPNRAIVAILAAIAEAIPFATYLPFDIGSNESRLAIASHQAGTATGGYALGEGMDGINIGKPYLSSERRVTLTLAVNRESATGKITSSGNTDTKLLRGRTKVYVNGFPVAFENSNTAATVANAPVSGSVRLGGTDYVIGGTVTPGTGAVSLTFSPALPENTLVEGEGYIDYELVPSLTPEIVTQVSTFALYAAPWRAIAGQTIDSRTQYQNELGLDLQSENLLTVRNQFAMERHYTAINKLKPIGASHAVTYDFDWDGQKADKTRARIWQDFFAVLGVADQEMAERTMDHGITHLYVEKSVASQLLSLPRELFEPSGVVARPSIYRLGRLFGRYEVYYTPKGLNASAGTAQILCVGRSSQVARCPIVLGDAVAPTVVPIATSTDMKNRQGFYARNMTEVNPHEPSARAVSIINITNMS